MLPEAGVVLDAGTGFFRVQERLETDNLDVFLSHAHLDHIIGLTFFMVPFLRGEVKTVRVHGTADTIASVKQHLLAEELFPVEPPYEWCELRESQSVSLVDGGRLSWTPLIHPGGSAGFRIDWSDRSLAYITDTTAPGDYLKFIRGVDVLIHECYVPDEMAEWAGKTGHSTAADVAQLAAEAAAGRLLLVHTDPQSCDDDPVGIHAMRAVFSRVAIAEDLEDVEF